MKMAKFSDQLEEVKNLLSSNTNAHKPFAYSTLLHLQEQHSTDSYSIQLLADSSCTLLSSILRDISDDDDEEIAAQALKCLGFTIYHPSLVIAIPGDDANLIVELLAKVILSTKMKTICNLGVWCISIQQLKLSSLAAHFHSLLTAVVHALNNPMGSLSTTFEAIQAVMKLATQLSEKMRDMSNVWAPPIYRRLVSADKRERDMSQRCLLKIRSIIFPPLLILSKVLVIDMKQKLLSEMKHLLNHGLKIQAIQAWGWFMNLLGPYAVKNKHLVNEMLKIPEQTFSDIDPQVRIASLVAWEGLINALIHPPACSDQEHGIQLLRSSNGNSSEIKADGLSKSMKLIVTPLVGIMSSKCDVSVHSACLNTWCYLLHKLENSIICPLVRKIIWEPIFEAVFQVGPDCKKVWLWNFCLDLLDNFISVRSNDMDHDLNNQVNRQISANNPIMRTPIAGKCSLQHIPVKCFPWDLSQLDFYIKIIRLLVSQESVMTLPDESGRLVCDAASRIFRSTLKGVQNALKNPAVEYNEVMLCLNTILRFTQKMFENMFSNDSGVECLHHNPLHFVEIVTEELEPSILGSPIYKVPLDLRYIENLQYEIRYTGVHGIRCAFHMDMVSPVVYLTTLYFRGVFKSSFSASKAELVLRGVQKYLKFVLSLPDPSENLYAIIGLLYKNMGFNCLKIWMAIASGLKEYADGLKDFSLLKLASETDGYLAVFHLLSYPFVVYRWPQKQLNMVEANDPVELSRSSSQPQRKLEFEHVVEVWRSLYVSVNHALQFDSCTPNKFSEDLTSILNGFLDDSGMPERGTELNMSIGHHEFDFISVCGHVVMCVLEHLQTSGVSSVGSKDKGDGINNCLQFVARFLMLSWAKIETNLQTNVAVTSGVFSALVCFVGRLHLKEDILSFVQIVSSPLLQWLSHTEVWDENTNHQLQLLWTETLNCLKRSWPPIVFDTSFLNLQSPLLEKTLNHLNSSISNPTITFWNSTYGEQIKLDYPQSLLHVLDKLSRTARLKLCRGNPPFIGKGHSRLEVVATPQRYTVTATQNRGSKRIEFKEAAANEVEGNGKQSLSSKRKRPELTEHQKEVRRAQQGREMDCDGRGPGIRTYPSVDFSQGNDESQESQEIRNADSILEMLRRAG